MSIKTKAQMRDAALAGRKRALFTLAIVASAIFAASAAAPVHAEDDNSKKLSLIHLLVRAGKNDAAADAMRSLYAKAPPASGDAALDYYDVIGNTDHGWDEARKGLEGLTKSTPEDVRCRIALARHLTRRKATRTQGMHMFAAAAKPQGADRQKVLEEWRHALDGLDSSPASMELYREYLALDPDNGPVREALASAQHAESKRLPWKMRDMADEQLRAGHPEQAQETLRKALKLDPANAWVRFDLSRLYHKRGDRKQGRALMEQGMSVVPGDPDMLYANALYVSLLDEPEHALRLLDKIPPAQRSAAMQRLKQKVAVRAQAKKAAASARDGKRARAQAEMEQAEAGAGSDAELADIVANGWIDLNDSARGIALMRRLATRPAAPLATRLYYAELLNRADQDQELAPLLDTLSAAKELAEDDKSEVRYLKSSLAARRADNLRHEGNIPAAKAVLVPALKQDRENYDLLMALARVQLAANEARQACETYQGILRRTPQNTSVRQALAGALLAAGDRAGAQREMAAVLASAAADDLDTRTAVAGWYLGIGDAADARAVVEQERKIAPGNARVLVQAALIAQADGNYSEAFNDFMQARAAGDSGDSARRLSWILRDKADEQFNAAHPEDAIDTLKRALQLDPRNAWVRFDLGRLFEKQGDTRAGRSVMEEGLVAAPDDADMLYANALYRSLLDDSGAALRLLEKIPDAQRSPSIQRLLQEMKMQAHLRDTTASEQPAGTESRH